MIRATAKRPRGRLLVSRRQLAGLGDTAALQNAVNAYAAIGVPATCTTYSTQSPTGGTITNDVCTVAGSDNWHDANLTALMSPAQLQAELDAERKAAAQLSQMGIPTSPTPPNIFATDTLTRQTAPAVSAPTIQWTPATATATPPALPTATTPSAWTLTPSPAPTPAPPPTITSLPVWNPSTSVIPQASTSTQQLVGDSGGSSIWDSLPPSVQNVVSQAEALAPWYVWAAGGAIAFYLLNRKKR